MFSFPSDVCLGVGLLGDVCVYLFLGASKYVPKRRTITPSSQPAWLKNTSYCCDTRAHICSLHAGPALCLTAGYSNHRWPNRRLPTAALGHCPQPHLQCLLFKVLQGMCKDFKGFDFLAVCRCQVCVHSEVLEGERHSIQERVEGNHDFGWGSGVWRPVESSSLCSERQIQQFTPKGTGSNAPYCIRALAALSRPHCGE